MNNSNISLVLAFDHPTRAVESVGIRMAAGLATLGFNVVTLSLPRDNAQLAQYAPSQVSGVLMLGPVPLSARPGGMKLWERFNCPISLFTLDAIIYDLARGRAREVVDYLIAARTDRRLGLVSPETGYRDWLGQALAITWDHMPFAAFPCVQIGPVETGEFGPDPVQLPSPGQHLV